MSSQTETTNIQQPQALWCIKFDTVAKEKVSEAEDIRQKIENCCRTAGVGYPSTLLVPTESSTPVLISYSLFKDREELKKQVTMERSSPEVGHVMDEADSQMSDHKFSRGIYLTDQGHFSSSGNLYLVVRISCEKNEQKSWVQKCQEIWDKLVTEGVDPGVIQRTSDDFRTFDKPAEIIWTISCLTADDLKQKRCIIEEDKDFSQSERVQLGEYLPKEVL